MKIIVENSQAQAVMYPETGSDFAADVLKGLSANPKQLDSKYFYNDKGSVLFQKIMHVPEYYLTRSEEEIFLTHKLSLFHTFTAGVPYIDIVELGAGDGIKTIILLRQLEEARYDFTYTAIDISSKALLELKESVNKELPDIAMRLIKNDYLNGLSLVSNRPQGRKVLLFLGSNIGNFSHTQSCDFLSKLRKTLNDGDLIMIGFDLKKAPDIIFNAYNDAQGITAAFNLNLLLRINEELGANFDADSFAHEPLYDADKGEARSYLRSLQDQKVWIEKLGREFSFAKNERIHTEISRKYGLDEISDLAAKTGFQLMRHLTDAKGYFCDAIWRAF